MYIWIFILNLVFSHLKQRKAYCSPLPQVNCLWFCKSCEITPIHHVPLALTPVPSDRWPYCLKSSGRWPSEPNQSVDMRRRQTGQTCRVYAVVLYAMLLFYKLECCEHSFRANQNTLQTQQHTLVFITLFDIAQMKCKPCFILAVACLSQMENLWLLNFS